MSEYGSVFDTNDIKKYLLKYNRDYTGQKSWESLYAGVGSSAAKQIANLSTDYSKAMTDAYASAYANKAAIASSNLGSGYKAIVEDELDAALEAAYDSYRANYLSSVADVEESAANANAQIDAVLEDEAIKYKEFAQKPYEYLQYLFNKFAEGNNEDNIFYTEDLWKRYTNEEFDENGDATGNRTLKSWDEIAGVGQQDENGEWTGLYDAENRLTIKGADFFDQMLNYQDSINTGSGNGFGSWLAENDPELFEWSQSYNPYDYTDAANRLGSFKTMFGLTSTDYEYSFFERFGGFSRKEVDGLYEGIVSKADELSKALDDMKGKGKDTTAIVDGYQDLVKEVKSITDHLGITDSLEAEMGMSFEQLAKHLSEIDQNVIKNTFLHTSGAGVGASLGAGGSAVGVMSSIAGGLSSIPVAGWIAAGVLAIGAGAYAAIDTSNTNKDTNIDLATQSRDAFNSLLTGLIEYSQYTRRESQKNFYK